jgi:hypothetical protein
LNLEQLKYPIGQFECPESISDIVLSSWISDIQQFPNQVMEVVDKLSIEELKLNYRPNGWNIKQVIHHCADSHSNAFIRFKLALTEENPNIKPYEEGLWAELIDGNDDDISHSLLILKGLHHKWILLLNSLNEKQWKRTYFHPESKKVYVLNEVAGLYAWHCKHHLAHIKQALEYKNKF